MKATPILFFARRWLVTCCWAGALLAAGNTFAASRPAIDLSRCYGPFLSESYLEAAAALQALPEAERVAQLRAWAAEPSDVNSGSGEFNDQVIMLCLMLFQSTHEEVVPAGGSHEIVHVPPASQVAGEADGRVTSLLLADDIPFAIPGRGPTGGRGPEQASSFLENCLANYGWSLRRYAPVGLAARQRALDILLNNYPWPRPLDARVTQFYSDQTKEYSPPPLRINLVAIRPGRTLIDSEHVGPLRGGRGEGGPQLWRIGSGGTSVEMGASGGVRPYRYAFIQQSAGGAPPVVIAHGNGLMGVRNPFSGETLMVPLPSPLPSVHDELIFKVTDARGTERKLTFRVTGPDELEVDLKNQPAEPGLKLPLWATLSAGLLALGGVAWYLNLRIRGNRKPHR